jgi:O-antigen/teichoic acid export membrane protein
MASIRRSFALSFAAKYSDLAISTVSIIVIARLLTPAEIGVYSVGAAVTALGHALRDFGVSNYLIQEKELTPARIRTALGMAIVVAWAMAFLIFLISDPITRFYGDPGLRRVLIILSASFLVIPFGSPVVALLRREMAFGALYVVGVTNSAVHAITAITLAMLGFSFTSLAWAALAAAAATAIAASAYRPHVAWLFPSLKEWRRVVRFGTISSGTAIVTQIGMSAPDIILGRILGFVAVGMYSRAQGLISVFHRDVMSAIANVALPAFALRHRERGDLKESYLKGLGFVTLFAWPFYGFLSVMTYPIVRLLFGSQWDAAVPLVRILAVAVAIGALWNLISHVLIAMGKIDNILRCELVIQPARIVMILIAAPFGLSMVAASQIIVYLIGLLVYYRQISLVLPISYSDVFRAVVPSIRIAVISLIAPALVIAVMEIGPTDLWWPFLVAFSGCGLGWLLGLWLSDHPAKAEVKSMIDHMVRR